MSKVYATNHIVDGDAVFAPGDEIHWHFRAPALEALIARGEASTEPPADVKPAWALEPLSYFPTTAGYRFRRGDRLDGKLPARLIAAAVERGEASYERPDDVDPIFAVDAVEHVEHAQRLSFEAGERVDGRAPDEIIAQWLKGGQATRKEPV